MKENSNSSPIHFSICTIVNDNTEYNLMKASFMECGFIEPENEYIILDNTKANIFDAYSAIQEVIKSAKGKYIIMLHQDVRCVDSKQKLIDNITELNNKDSNWAIAGNAGVIRYHEPVLHLTQIKEIYTNDYLPLKVQTLDENFLVFNSSKNIEVTNTLRGFHLYGTDLCLHANTNGYNCYVISFMVKHLSKGNLKDLENYMPFYLKNTAYKNFSGYVETTCTKFYISKNKSAQQILNIPFFFFFIKSYWRLIYGFRKLSGKVKKSNKLKISTEHQS